jgi:hypothetical protein
VQQYARLSQHVCAPWESAKTVSALASVTETPSGSALAEAALAAAPSQQPFVQHALPSPQHSGSTAALRQQVASDEQHSGFDAQHASCWQHASFVRQHARFAAQQSSSWKQQLSWATQHAAPGKQHFDGPVAVCSCDSPLRPAARRPRPATALIANFVNIRELLCVNPARGDASDM